MEMYGGVLELHAFLSSALDSQHHVLVAVRPGKDSPVPISIGDRCDAIDVLGGVTKRHTLQCCSKLITIPPLSRLYPGFCRTNFVSCGLHTT